MKRQTFFIYLILTPFFIAMVSVMVSVMPFAKVGIVYAMEGKEEKEKKQSKLKIKKGKVLGKIAFNDITKAQELLAKKNYDGALKILNNMLKDDRFNEFERANAHINVGMVYAEKGDYKETIRRFSSALESGVLPTANEQDITFQLVKLSLAEEDTQSAIKYLDRWEKGTTKISADAQALRAHIFLIEKDYEQAETFIRKALSTHKKPKESWQRILVSILLTTKRYEDALPVLEMLVAKYPDKKVYWQQITATYYVLDMEEKAFSALQNMHTQNMLTTSEELSRLARLYLYYKFPYKAAKILDKGFSDNKIEKSEKNWETLATAWRHSSEWKKSRAPLLEAAKLSKEGKHYLKLGESYIHNEDWANAEKYLALSLEKGKLGDKEEDVWFLLGIAQAKQEQYQKAIKTFRKAGEFDDVAKDSFMWVHHIEKILVAKRQEKEAQERAERLKEKQAEERALLIKGSS